MSAQPGEPVRLEVRTVPITDPSDLLGRLPSPAALAWIHRGDGLVGWGEAARILVPAGPDRFGWARDWLRELFATSEVDDAVDVPGSGPVAFGSFTFDPAARGSVLIVPRVVLGRQAGKAWSTTVGTGVDPVVPIQPIRSPGGVQYEDGTLSTSEWKQAVATAVGEIEAGRLDKVVLTRDLHAAAREPIDARPLLQRLATRFPECYTFACAGLAGATPELLISRIGDQISSLVLAGTTGRGATPSRDAALGAALLDSAKDVEEHLLSVASVRQALAPLCRELTADAKPWLLSLANVHHLASRLIGRLDDDACVLELVAALHPTAAVCGTPAEAALELIRKLEGMDRGRYTGPIGWIDSRGNGEWGIALRCAELNGASARLFAGSGIVAGSDPVAELAEAQTKFEAMRYALEDE